MNIKKILKINKISLFVAFAFSILRLVLFVDMPYYFNQYSPDDELLMVTLAMNILKLKWLGNFCNTTFVKGVSFPIFLAFNYVLHIPFSITLFMLYVVSAIFFSFVVGKNSVEKLLIYLIILFFPVGFMHATQRVYRMQLIFPLVVIIVAYSIYILKKEKINIMHLLIYGFVFTFFYHIREESIWLMPLFVLTIVLSVVKRIIKKEKNAYMLVVPILIFVLCTQLLCFTNYIIYGSYEYNNRTKGIFNTYCNNLNKIKDDTSDALISINKIEKLAKYSDTFNLVKDNFIKIYNEFAKNMKDAGAIGIDDNGNFLGDHSGWAFRYAMQESGYYDNPIKAKNFLLKCDSELNNAVLNGDLVLDEKIHLSSSAKGFYINDIPKVIFDTFSTCFDIFTIRLEEFGNKTFPWTNLNEDENLYKMEKIYRIKSCKEISSANNFSVMVGNIIINIWKTISNIILYFSIIVCISMFIYKMINKKYEYIYDFLMQMCLLGCSLLLAFCVYLGNWGDGTITFYGTGIFATMITFCILVINNAKAGFD